VTTFVVGLGSNLGQRLDHLRAGARSSAHLGRITAVSTVFESDPVGGPVQGPYLNAAFRLESDLTPEELLSALLGIERTQGRERRERWGPRTLDLDVLWAPGLVRSSPAPVLPHPRLTDRPFALVPLLEVAPEARDPHSDRRYDEWLSGLSLGGLRRLARQDPWCPEFPREIRRFQAL
jgi:2-amino-4-hydroxy-6-hydroxymethyldihydropteridine diphosphokinase